MVLGVQHKEPVVRSDVSTEVVAPILPDVHGEGNVPKEVVAPKRSVRKATACKKVTFIDVDLDKKQGKRKVLVYDSTGEDVEELYVCSNSNEESKRSKSKKVCLTAPKSKGCCIKNKRVEDDDGLNPAKRPTRATKTEKNVAKKVEVEAKKFTIRLSPVGWCDLVLSFIDAQTKAIRDMWFDGFLCVNCTRMLIELSKWLVDHFDCDSSFLIFTDHIAGEDKILPIQDEDVELCVGLLQGPEGLVYIEKDGDENSGYKELLKQWKDEWKTIHVATHMPEKFMKLKKGGPKFM